MIIRVTQGNIDDGIRGNCWSCPVARAINEAYKFKVTSQVQYETISITTDHFRTHCFEMDTPQEVYDLILPHDFNKKEMKPFEFEIPFELP